MAKGEILRGMICKAIKSTGAVEAVKEEFQKRLVNNYPGATFAVRRAHSDGLSVMGGTARDKEVIDVMLQNTRVSMEEWFDFMSNILE